MRLFNGTAMGVHIDDNSGLLVGETKVEFLPSLYTTRGSTFGNSLMFAQLVKGQDGIHRLQGCPVDSHQIRGMEALVVLALKIAPSAKVTHPADSFGAKVALAQHVNHRYPRELEINQFHALVSLKPGSEIEFTETYIVSDIHAAPPPPTVVSGGCSTMKRNRRGRGKTAIPVANFPQVERYTKHRVAFDGNTVTISSTN